MSDLNLSEIAQDLRQVAQSDDTEQLEQLLAMGVDVDAATEHGTTALMFAASRGNIKMVRALIDHGADPNAIRKDKITPLLLAAFFGHSEIVRILVEHGAETKVKSLVGTSAHMWAKARGFPDIAAYLQKANGNGQSVRDVAVSEPNPAVQTEREFLKPPPISTLKDPPEIWDLVHPVSRSFDPGAAFIARIRSLSRRDELRVGTLLLLAVVLGLAAFTYFRNKVPTAKDARAESAQEVKVSDQNSGQSLKSDIDKSSSVEVRALTQTTEDRPEMSHTSSLTPSAGPRLDAPINSSTRSSRVSKPRRCSEDGKSRENDDNAPREQTNIGATYPAVESVSQPAKSSSPREETSRGNTALSPQLIAPAKSSRSKPKIIQWP